MYKNLCLTLIFFFSTLLGAHGANYSITGDADFFDVNTASAFGVGASTTGTFTAFLKFDDMQSTTDAIELFLSPTHDYARYNLESLSWSLGTQNWSYATAPTNFVKVQDGKNNSVDDSGVIDGNVDQAVANGITITRSVIFANDDNGDVFSGVEASNFNLFNSLIGANFGNIAFAANTGAFGGQVGLSNIIVSAVPLPAGVWLLGSVMFGFGAFRRKIAASRS